MARGRKLIARRCGGIQPPRAIQQEQGSIVNAAPQNQPRSIAAHSVIDGFSEREVISSGRLGGYWGYWPLLAAIGRYCPLLTVTGCYCP